MKNILILSLLFMATMQAEGTETSTASLRRTVNITTNALSLSGTSLQADFPISEKSSLGPILGYGSSSTGTSSYSTYILGLSYNYMLSTQLFTDGWSVNGGFQYTSSKSSIGTSASGFAIGALIQDNWFWENGFNMNAGIGAEYASLDLTALGISGKLTGVIPQIGFNVGYVF